MQVVVRKRKKMMKKRSGWYSGRFRPSARSRSGQAVMPPVRR
jgi:hypothetical protein